jgi:hypothetical protein
VCAGVARFFEDGNRERIPALFLLQLCETQCRRHPRRAAADDQNVNFERLAGSHATLDAGAVLKVLNLQLVLFVVIRRAP